jgi:hypothetical protein
VLCRACFLPSWELLLLLLVPPAAARLLPEYVFHVAIANRLPLPVQACRQHGLPLCLCLTAVLPAPLISAA